MRIIAVLLAMLSACTGPQSIQETEQAVPDMPTSALMNVQVSPARLEGFVQRVEGTGTISPARKADLFFPERAAIQYFPFQNGNQVKKGQLLARLDNVTAQLNLQRAELAFQKADIDYQNQLIGFEQSGELTEKVKETLALKTGLSSALLELKMARAGLDKTQIRAPFSGLLADIDAQVNILASTAKPFALLYDPTQLYIDIQVLEGMAVLLQSGQEADVETVAFPGKTHKALVQHINPKVDQRGMVQVRLKLLDPGALIPGMRGKGIVYVPVQESVVVPKEALVYRNGKPVVFTLKDGKSHWNYVTLGLDNGREVQIIEGLQASDQVIVTNNLQLAHEVPVQAVQTALPSAN